MSIYKEVAGGYGDWRDVHSGKSGLELVPAYDRSRVVRLLRLGICGPWDGLTRTNTLLEKLRDHLVATHGAGWATFPELDELCRLCRDLDTVGEMRDANGQIPPVTLYDVTERVRQLVYQEFISP